MEKQVVIYVKGGNIINVETNFNGSYQIIDYDLNKDEEIGDILEPDTIKINEDIFKS